MDPALSNFMSNLKRQVVGRKLSSLTGIEKEKADVEEIVSPVAVATPAVNRKRGHPPKAQASFEVGPSSGRPLTMLGSSMRVASAMQFELRPEDEGVLVAIPTKDLIEELVELQSRATVVGRVIGDELNRTQTVVVPKLKAKLEESIVSLKSAIEAAETCREEMEKKDRLAKEEQETLKTMLAKVMVERDQLVK